ncbi:hexose carrier protein [Hortaea werneckii]|nr:hexose carrier protein [Hortaea werneckii]KAI7100598.1 hexose carrier protein [Hortaea werneckii]KAI7242616.1 hexose carrier protein [Hortaea werneckii]KAI7328288.1 hexose carrier protein [Hortaea werneckii]KAI7393994.1 hexose carrier protein [Hortaea werneckii]
MAFNRLEGRRLLGGITTSCCLGFMLFGYDQGVFGGLLANSSFQEQFNHPSTTIESQIVSTYTLGCIAGSVVAIFTGNPLGRRNSILLGCAFLTVGGILQATSYSLAHMIVGRVVSGIGIGFNTTTIPMWQSETCKASLRGKLVALQLACLVFGFVLTNWMNFGFTYIPNNPVSWRFPLGFQAVLALGTACLVPFLVESPRWLCLKDRHAEAKENIARLFAKEIGDWEVQETLDIMIETIASERAEGEIGWREVFHNGVNVVAYYLPVVLERSFGFTPRMSLILSACDSMQWMFWGTMMIFVIERFGRKKLMLFGASGCSLCFAVSAIGLGIGTQASNGVAVAFIFLFYFFFGMSFMGIGFLYPSEINGNRSRSLGAAIAMVTNWIGVYIVVSITPVGIQNIGWRFYIIFAVLNAAWLPFIWFFYVETAGLSLDEIDRVFVIKHAPNSGLTYPEAIQQAKAEMEVERLHLRNTTRGDEGKGTVEHVENTV